jgi:hypothetical protein
MLNEQQNYCVAPVVSTIVATSPAKVSAISGGIKPYIYEVPKATNTVSASTTIATTAPIPTPLVTNNFLPSQKVFATPARGFAGAKHRCAFRFPTKSTQVLFSSHKKAKTRLRGFAFLWRRGESNPRAMTDGLRFYDA